MKNRILPLILLGFFLCSSVFSKEIPINDARNIAENFYMERTMQSSQMNPADFIIATELNVSKQGQTLFYVFNLEADKGFVIISAHDNIFPVLGYSTRGYYSPGNLPVSFSVMIENMKEQVFVAKQNNISATSKTLQAWQYYSQKPQMKPVKGVQALMFTTWDQGCYYNEDCPTVLGGGLCNKADAGDIAVAMAQIMKYHNYPMHGTGSHTYDDPGFGQQTADFGNATYLWATMPNFLMGQNSAIAQAIYHCAVSVETQFSPTFSTFNFIDARDALIDYFNYASCATYIERDDYNDSVWIKLMKIEIDAGRPVLYSGYSSSGSGYAFVCDGYDDNDMFHFNWGYGGYFNGYFLIENLNPGSGNVSLDQAAIIGIEPNTPSPVANFMADPLTLPVGDTVMFTDLSSGNPTAWEWDFGDGSTSTQQNPEHAYSNPGVYTVRLTVTSADGIDMEIKMNYINVPTGVILNCGWQEVASGFPDPYRGINWICPVNQNVVWASAADNDGDTIFTPVQDYTITTDGGATWTSGNIPYYPDLSIINICAISDMQAWAALVSYNTGGGNIMVTIDGGQTWIHQNSATFFNGFLAGVHFFDAFNGVAIGNVVDGYFQLYLTPDGGNFWVRIDSTNIPYPMNNEAVYPGVFTTWDDTHVWFGTTRGRVFMTNDAGLTWTASSIGANEVVTSLAFKDANNGLVTTDNPDVIYRTTDGGQSWVAVIPQGDVFNSDLSYVPGTAGAYVSCGAGGSSFTLNDGGLWTLIDVEDHYAVGFFDNIHGWAGGTNYDSLIGGIYQWNPGTCFNQAVPLMPEFISDRTNACAGDVIAFFDASSPANITAWNWNVTPATVAFVGGTGPTSQNPEIQFNDLGQYTIELEITTPYGNSSITKTDYISVVASSIPFSDDFDAGYTDNFLMEDAQLSDIYIGAGGTNGTNCLVFTGGDQNAGWNGNQNNTSANQAWNQNVTHHSRAYTCEIDATSHPSLILSFDLRETYSYGRVYTWFRVLINDTVQIEDFNGDMNFNPNSESNDPFETKSFDLSNWGGTVFTLTLQAACKYNDTYYGSNQFGNNYVYVDNLSVTDYVPIVNDVGVTSVIQPTGGICGSPATPVEVEVMNYGTDTLWNIPVKVSVEDPMGFVSDLYDTIAGPFDPMSVITAQMGDVDATLAGTFMITAFTQLTGDTDNSNDTVHGLFYTIETITTFPFLEDFSSGATDYFQLTDAEQSIIQINNTGVNGTMGLNFQGGENTAWQGQGSNTTANNAWNDNVLHQAQAMTCNVDATGLTNLRLSFDLKQWYGYVPEYAWFRVLVNNSIQLQDLNGIANYNPFTYEDDPFVRRVFDLSLWAGTNFTITLQACNKYSDSVYIQSGFGPHGDNAFVDNIMLFVPDDIDMGVSEVNNPLGSSCGVAVDSVWLTVKNYGVVRQYDIPVTAGIIDPMGGVTPMMKTITDTIEPEQTLMVNMGPINTTMGGIYQIGGFTSMPGDNNHLNDTAGALYTSIGPIFSYPFSEDFQSGMSTYFRLEYGSRANAFYDLDAGNYAMRFIGAYSNQGWQGQGGSVTPYNAWEENTTHQSAAITCDVDATTVSNLLLSFDLKQINTYDYTDYSWFRLLLSDTLQLPDVRGVTDFNSYTPMDDPYRKVYFDLSHFAGLNFTLTFNACCKYDSTRNPQDYPEGDAVFIDNINLFERSTNDAGVISLIRPTESLYCGHTGDSAKVEIFNFGVDTISDIPVTFMITDPLGNVQTVSDTYLGDLPPLTSAEIFLGLVDIFISGDYTTKAYTSLPGDIISINDTVCSTFSIAHGMPIPFVDDFQGWWPLDNWDGDFEEANTGDQVYIGKFMHNDDTTVSTIYANAMTNIKIGPIHANSYLLFDYVLWDTNFYAYNLQMGESVQVSLIDCNFNINTILILDEAHQAPSPHFTHMQFPLAAYETQELFIGFEVTAKDNDFYFYIDNVMIVDAAELDLGPDTTVCDNTTITLDAGIPDVYYTWYDENFMVYSNKQTLTVDSTGIGLGSKMFYLMLTDENGIQVLDSITVTFKDCSGIDEYGLDKFVNIYPNPSDGLFYISTKEIKGALDLNITDAKGQLIFKQEIIPDSEQYTHRIDLSSLAKGVYFVKIMNSDNVMNRKIVIQ